MAVPASASNNSSIEQESRIRVARPEILTRSSNYAGIRQSSRCQYNLGMSFSITVVQENHLEEVRRLFLAYAGELNIDLCFQNFEEELASLPGKYAEPEGGLILVFSQGRAVACGAIRPIGRGDVELKRVYVEPEFRGSGIGAMITQHFIAEASEKGYARLVLDTLARLTPAIALYKKLGFAECEPYYPNPEPDVVYMSLELSS